MCDRLLPPVSGHPPDSLYAGKRPILFVDHAQALGGAEHSLLMLLARLGPHAWQPHLATAPGELAAAAADLPVPVHLLSLPALRRSLHFPRDLAGKARALTALANDTGAEALYANTVRAALYTALAAKLCRRPFIWHLRDFWLSEEQPARPWLDTMLKKLLLRAATLVVVNSRAVAANLPRSSRVQVVLNGIDISGFQPGRGGESFRAEHGIPRDIPVISTAGRLRPWKGQDRFLRVARQVHATHPDAYFVIAGGSPFSVDDDYPLRLRNMVSDLAMQDRVLFTGHLRDIRPVLAASDLFIHAGNAEPFGLVNVEAMAMAVPVVAFAHGALPEIIADGVTGRLVPALDESALAAAVRALLDQPTHRKHMGVTARRRAQERFSIERVVAEIDQLLRRHLGDR